MTNFARSSLVLVLNAIFGAAKSCPLVNLFMICPPVGWWLADHWLADHDQILPPDPGHLMALGTQCWDLGPKSRTGKRVRRQPPPLQRGKVRDTQAAGDELAKRRPAIRVRLSEDQSLILDLLDW
jgi:hypothetical protein